MIKKIVKKIFRWSTVAHLHLGIFRKRNILSTNKTKNKKQIIKGKRKTVKNISEKKRN